MIAKPRYGYNKKWIAVVPIKMSQTDWVQPGEVVKVRRSHLLVLYRRGWIGEQGHPWTKMKLDYWRHKHGKPVETPKEDKPKDEPKKADKPADKGKGKGKQHKPDPRDEGGE